ncbi:MAG TPA: orotate phosphoribosyltransferase [Acidiferrobacteraceae bacterium]|nr:orotate phosphoribosyltransferase [Acidiferrobacteraceae bacterium]
MTQDARTTQFFDLALRCGVLRFGEFVLKSGRVSPYFFNAGLFHSGASIGALGRLYARTALAAKLDFDLVFGPAYKGIPLAAATTIGLAEEGRDVGYAFNRKEAKDHGEGGTTIGYPLPGHRALIVDDVISSGTSIHEAVALLRNAGAEPVAVVIALDRQERGLQLASAIEEVRQRVAIPVLSIATVGDLLEYLQDQPQGAERSAAIRAYLEKYGSAAARP